MRLKKIRRLVGALVALGGLVTAGTAAASPTVGTTTHTVGTRATAPGVSVLASGLDEPKYMQFAARGLYVAESGHGGGACTALVGVTGAPTQACVGATGAVARINADGHVKTVMSGLASAIEKDNHEVAGPIALAVRGDRVQVLNRGLFVGPTGASSIPGKLAGQFGKLEVAAGQHSRLDTVANISGFAAKHPQSPATLGGLPGELTYDSDAHDAVPYRGGCVIADAGANDVLWQSPAGKLSVIARLPTVPENAPAGALGAGSPAQDVNSQAVPSSVAIGPDGSIYVGTLGGLPGLPGTESVYRVAPGKAPVQVVGGLTRVSDIAFDGDRLLILESNVMGTLSPPTTPGALLEGTLADGTVAHVSNLGIDGLVQPNGIAVGSHGEVYISNHSDTPRQGEILRVAASRLG